MSEMPQMSNPQRMKLTDVSVEQMRLIESYWPKPWPDVWAGISRSLAITLLSNPEWYEMSEGELVAKLTMGVGYDLGGAQYYIPSMNTEREIKERREKVLRLLREGKGYREVALETGLCDSHVRKIERKAMADRKGSSNT